jgi:hypothetical protein
MYCRRCKHALLRTQKACPECGRAFHGDKPSTFLTTNGEWSDGQVRIAAIGMLFVVLVACLTTLWAFWRFAMWFDDFS